MKTLGFDVEEILRLFNEQKVFELRGISSRLTREAAMTNDYAKAELGIIAYALHKLETKQHYSKNNRWIRVKQVILDHLKQAESAAMSNNQKLFFESLKTVILSIRNIDDELGNFAQNVYEKAKVKEASLAYSYGLSIAQAAALTGADQKELQSYIGFTTMHDEEGESKSISKRVEELRKLVEA